MFTGIITPHLSYITKTCEGNWTTKWNIEQYEPTNVWVNGREVHPLDLEHFKRLRLPIKPVEKREPAAFWKIDENGEITPEEDSTHPTLKRMDSSIVDVKLDSAKWVVYSPLNVEVSKRQKAKNRFASLKGERSDGFHVYNIHITCGSTVIQSECRFNQFEEFDKFVSSIQVKLKRILK